MRAWAIRRVKLRVALGGHSVPDDVVRRRFTRSLSNFYHLYRPLANDWVVFDNSHPGNAEPLAQKTGTTLTVLKERAWQKLQKINGL